VADFAVRSWTGLFAPHGTPTALIARLAAALRDILALPAVRGRLVEMASEPLYLDPAETTRFVAAEYIRWAAVVRAANITPD